PQPWQGCALPTELFPHALQLTPANGQRQAHPGSRDTEPDKLSLYYPEKPITCAAYHTVYASRPERAASPRPSTALPSESVNAAATPPSSGALLSHSSTRSPSGPYSFPICSDSDSGAGSPIA